MDEKGKVAHKANAHDKGSHASVGKSIMRFSVLFVLTCVLVPVVMLVRDVREKESFTVSIWWLKPLENEMKMMEEVEGRDYLQKKISHWAHQQKSAAKLYSSIFGRGAFCRSSYHLQALRQHQLYESKLNPIVWDALIGDRGSTVNLIVSSRSEDLSSSTSSSSPSVDGMKDSNKNGRSNGNSNNVLLSSSSTPIKRVTCRLYDHRSQLLATVTSLNIVDGLLVRCPIPYELRQQATGQDVRLGVKLIWPEVDSRGKDTSSSRSRGLLAGSGTRMLGYAKNSLPAEDKRVGSVDVLTQNRSQPIDASHFTAAAGAGAGAGGVGHTMGRPLYPVCPLAVSSRMMYTYAEGSWEKRLTEGSRGGGGGFGKGQGQGGGIRVHGLSPSYRGSEGDVEQDIVGRGEGGRGEEGRGEGGEEGSGRSRGRPALESGESNTIHDVI